ncbi:MAG: hypothetical protein LBT57_01610, partial [Puniceicoccales bacterium]|nr:hypothetical protein [Puniceicoccales bacterium]
MKKQYNSTVDWLRNLFCCGRGSYREEERRLLAQDALVPEVNIPLIAITADSIQEIIDNIIGQAREAPGGIYEAMAQSCFPSARINLDNVRILRSLLAQMATENPGVAVFWDSSIMRGALEIAQRTLNPSAIPQWSDFCALMASLPSIEIFTLQALKVLEALSERPQGGEEPRPGQQCEVNLPKLLEILQESGLGGEGTQILTGLFTPHFQSNAIGVVDLMCTCHALVNYELMTNPTRLACALVNT